MRRRLLWVLREYVDIQNFSMKLARHVERECGIDVVRTGSYSSYPDWDMLFLQGELRDVFDTLTFAIRGIPDRIVKDRITVTGRKQSLKNDFSRIFEEECVGYQIDETGAVLRRFDEALEAERTRLIGALDHPRFAAALRHLSTLDASLLEVPIDGRRAVRAIFDVLENIFKLAFSGSAQLKETTINQKLRPRIDGLLADDRHAAKAVQKTCSSLVDWVDAAHFYRHEPGKSEHEQPPEAFVIAMVGTGYSFARWLAEIAFD